MKKSWGGMIEGYFSGSRQLVHVIQLVDLRHDPTRDDEMMMNYLRHYQIPYTIVATKADKLSRAQRSKQIAAVCRTLGVQPWQVIAFSGVDRTGKAEVLSRLDEIIAPQQDMER